MRQSMRRTILGLTASFALAAALAGSALAVTAPDAFERAVNRSTVTPSGVAADAHQRAARTEAPAPPDWFERAAGRLATERSNVPLDASDRAGTPGSTSTFQVSETSSANAFAWGDAALGAFAALAVAALVGGALIPLRHRRRVVVS